MSDESNWFEKRFVTVDTHLDWERLLERGICVKKEKGVWRIYLEPRPDGEKR